MKLIFMSLMLNLLYFKPSMNMMMILLMFSILYMYKDFSFLTEFYSNIISMDMMSFLFVSMTLSICMIIVMYNKNKSNYYIFILSMLLSIMFMIDHFFFFFFFFECCMFPILLVVMGWGTQPEKIESFMYFSFYTFISSMPVLIMLYLYSNYSSMSFSVAWMMSNLHMNMIFVFLLIFTFLVKMPLFITHYWLPKAHVEAPIEGSMILAAILLKMGGYALLKLMTFYYSNLLMYLLMSLAMVGSIISCFECLFNVDIKVIIAYSSVMHMNFLILSLLMMNTFSMTGSLIMMISHGFVSSMMFMIADFSYKRFNSRSIMIIKCIITLNSLLTLFWIFAFMFNMSFPPSMGMISEIMMSMSIFYKYNMYLFLIMVYFLSAFYSMFIFYTLNFGGKKYYLYINKSNINFLEIVSSVSHILFIIMYMLLLKLMINI